jgi:two-component system, OmpR family, response regulator ArlR
MSQSILIVDDYPGILRGLNLFLREEGYEVDEAYNWAEAVKKLSGREFDLVLCDIVMPGIDGSTLLRQFLSLVRHNRVILMSGNPAIDRDMLILHGATDFIAKPFFLQHLLQKIQHVLPDPS